MGYRTGRIAVLGAWLTVGALCVANSAQAAKLIVSDESGDPGQQVSVTVTLAAEGASVAGTQNDIAFDSANIPIAPRSSGKCSVTKTKTCSADGDCPAGEFCAKAPDCAVNPDIDKGATSFAFRPSNCNGAACTSVRALVLSTANVDPIADGSVLYTCKVNIAPTASGRLPLTISGIILSDPDGQQVSNATGTNGSVTAGGGPLPTNTPEQPACNAPAIQVDTVTGTKGATVDVDVSLRAGSASIAGTQNDITFDAANAPIAPKSSGKCSVTKTKTCSADGDCPAGEFCAKAPDCAVNPDIDKGATSFAFRPSNCNGAACTSVRALVLSTANVDPIPDDSVLFTCKVNVAANAPDGTYPLTVSGVILSDPDGQQVSGATGCNGAVVLGPAGTPISTATEGVLTPTPPPPTNTPTFTPPLPTNTVPPTATRTNTPAPTATKTSAVGPTPFDDDGGCHISMTGSSNVAWLLLLPAVALMVMKRRR